MLTFEQWLTVRGPVYAQQIDAHADALCGAVTMRLSAMFPALCYDAVRPDAELFQQQTFRETSRRFHCLIQVVLRLQSLIVVEQEYRWAMHVLPRYGVQPQHMLALVHLYFDLAHALVPPNNSDESYVMALEHVVTRIIEAVTIGKMHPC